MKAYKVKNIKYNYLVHLAQSPPESFYNASYATALRIISFREAVKTIGLFHIY
jgi:hypothetical protein